MRVNMMRYVRERERRKVITNGVIYRKDTVKLTMILGGQILIPMHPR